MAEDNIKKMPEKKLTSEEKLWKYKNIRYINLTNLIGEDMARYCCCAAFNVAYNPDIDCVSFEDYCDQIGDKKFKEGILSTIQDEDIDDATRSRWRKEWGTGDKTRPYSVDDYIQLDQIFETYSARLEKSGGMDEWQEDTLRSCSRMRLESDKCLAKGGKDNVDMASKLNKMIQEQLASEQLRKKDEKPIGVAQITGIVQAMAKKYGVGSELDYEQAIEICSKWLVSHKYPHTMDAAEHMLLAIINTTRENNDMPLLGELPEEAKFPASMVSEFEEKPSEAENEAYEYLNLKRKKNPRLF